MQPTHGSGGAHPYFNNIQDHHTPPQASTAAPPPEPSAPAAGPDDTPSDTQPKGPKPKRTSSAESLAKRQYFNNPRRNVPKTAPAKGDEAVAVELPHDKSVNDGDALEVELPKNEEHEKLMSKIRMEWSDTLTKIVYSHNELTKNLPGLPQLQT